MNIVKSQINVITPPNSDTYLRDQSLSLTIKVKGLIPQCTKQIMGIDPSIKSLYPPKKLGINPNVNEFVYRCFF